MVKREMADIYSHERKCVYSSTDQKVSQKKFKIIEKKTSNEQNTEYLSKISKIWGARK